MTAETLIYGLFIGAPLAIESHSRICRLHVVGAQPDRFLPEYVRKGVPRRVQFGAFIVSVMTPARFLGSR